MNELELFQQEILLHVNKLREKILTMPIDCPTAQPLKRYVITSPNEGGLLSTGDTLSWVNNGTQNNTDVVINGIDQGPSTSGNSYVLTDVPSGDLEVCLVEIFPQGGLGEACCFTYQGPDVSKEIDFGQDVAMGNLTSTQVDNFTSTNLNFSNGLNNLQVVNGALRNQILPASNGSSRSEFGFLMPDSRCYELTQTVLWETNPASFGGVSNQTTKIGFGIGSDNYVSGNTVDPSGTSIRVSQRNGNYVGYSYAHDRPNSFGQDYNNANVVPITPGVPQTVYIKVCKNTGANSDGSFEMRVDGVLVDQRNNVCWQTSNHNWRDCRFQQFFGGSDSSWSPSATQFITVSNVSYNALP